MRVFIICQFVDQRKLPASSLLFLLSLPFLSVLKRLRRNQTEPNKSTTADTEVTTSTTVLLLLEYFKHRSFHMAYGQPNLYLNAVFCFFLKEIVLIKTSYWSPVISQ